MAGDLIQFVDSVAASPTVRLDLNDGTTWNTSYDGTDVSPPQLKQSWAGSLLADGEQLTAAAYANRRLRLSLDLTTTTVDGQATELQKLWRELNRPDNFLRWQPNGSTNPVFFHTFRSSNTTVQEYPGSGMLRTLHVEIDAEPFAYGLKETVGTTTVYNDPAEGTTLNANPFFEVDASNWTPTGGTAVRSTAQFHEGAASLLFTPDGVTVTTDARSENVPATVGTSYRASAWVRCAVARNVSININWRNSGGGLLSTSSSVVSVSATTWTFLDLTATAPASTALAQLTVSMGSTPPSSNTLHIDEARLRQSGDVGGLCFDVASPKGDVESPLFLSMPVPSLASAGRRTSAISVRRRGTVSAVPLVLQAETMTTSTDTTLQSNDTTMSGAGSNYMRCTFSTAPAMNGRLTVATFPASPSVDARGTYRVFARVRKSVGTDVITMRLDVSADGALITGDTVTLPSGTAIRWVDISGQTPLQFPVGYDPVEDGYSGTILQARGLSLILNAARAVGSTGNLDIDALVFMPADDKFCLVKWPEFSGPTSFVLDSAATAVFALGASGEVRTAVPVPIAGLPPMVTPGVTNRVCFILDVGSTTTSGDDKTSSVAVTSYYWPRYLAVRPVAS